MNDNNQDLPSAVDDAATAMAESAAKIELTEEEKREEELKRKLEALRKRDPFVYR